MLSMLLLMWFQILQYVLSPSSHVITVIASVVSDCCVSWLSVFMLLFQWFQILKSVLIPYFHVTVSMVSDSAECFDPLFSCYCFNGFRFCSMSWSPVSTRPLSAETEIFLWEDHQLQNRTMMTTSSVTSSTASLTLTIPLAPQTPFAFCCCSSHPCSWSRPRPTSTMLPTSTCFCDSIAANGRG